jgi:hypothetical protein
LAGGLLLPVLPLPANVTLSLTHTLTLNRALLLGTNAFNLIARVQTTADRRNRRLGRARPAVASDATSTGATRATATRATATRATATSATATAATATASAAVAVAVAIAIADTGVAVAVIVAVADTGVAIAVAVTVADTGVAIAVAVTVADTGVAIAVAVTITDTGIAVAVSITTSDRHGVGITSKGDQHCCDEKDLFHYRILFLRCAYRLLLANNQSVMAKLTISSSVDTEFKQL